MKETGCPPAVVNRLKNGDFSDTHEQAKVRNFLLKLLKRFINYNNFSVSVLQNAFLKKLDF